MVDEDQEAVKKEKLNVSKSITAPICYSIPRLIITPITTIFSTHLRDLYVDTFKWHPENFNTTYLIYTLALTICYFIISISIDVFIKNKNNDDKLKTSKIIEIVAVAIYSLTLLLLVLLPYIWYNNNSNQLYESPEPSLTISKLGSEKPLSKELSVLDYLEPPPEYEAIYGVTSCKRSIICLLVAVRATGFALFELCNRALPMYIYANDNDAYIKLKQMNSINICFYGFGMLLTNSIISLMKFFLHHIISDNIFFLIIAILLLICQIPIMFLFHKFAKPESKSNNQEDSVDGAEASQSQQQNSNNSTIFDSILLFSVTIFHGSIIFWLYTLNPLSRYISAYIHDRNSPLKTFGPITFLVIFIAVIIGYTFYNFSVDDEYEYISHILIGIYIPSQTIVYLLFHRLDYWWNKNSWLNYTLFAIYGIGLGPLMSTIYNTLDSTVDSITFKGHRWKTLGGFFSYTQLVVSLTSYHLYRLHDNEGTTNRNLLCIRLTVVYNFANLYRIITFLFILANIIAALNYFIGPTLIKTTPEPGKAPANSQVSAPGSDSPIADSKNTAHTEDSRSQHTVTRPDSEVPSNPEENLALSQDKLQSQQKLETNAETSLLGDLSGPDAPRVQASMKPEPESSIGRVERSDNLSQADKTQEVQSSSTLRGFSEGRSKNVINQPIDTLSPKQTQSDSLGTTRSIGKIPPQSDRKDPLKSAPAVKKIEESPDNSCGSIAISDTLATQFYNSLENKEKEVVDRLKGDKFSLKEAMQAYVACNKKENLAKEHLNKEKTPTLDGPDIKPYTATDPQPPADTERVESNSQPTSLQPAPEVSLVSKPFTISPPTFKPTEKKVKRPKLQIIAQERDKFLGDAIKKFRLTDFIVFNLRLDQIYTNVGNFSIGGSLGREFNSTLKSLNISKENFKDMAIEMAKTATSDFESALQFINQSENTKALENLSNGLKKSLLLHQPQLGQIKDSFNSLKENKSQLIGALDKLSEKSNGELSNENLKHCQEWLKKFFTSDNT